MEREYSEDLLQSSHFITTNGQALKYRSGLISTKDMI
jgi:hypothetical protein